MLKMKGLGPAMLIPREVAIHKTQPETTSRIGRNFAGGRHPRHREFFPDFEILNANERPVLSPSLDPNVMVHVLGDPNNHPRGVSVTPVDSTKFSIFVDCQPVIYANPQSANMIFEEGRNLMSGQTFPMRNRRDTVVIDNI
jgi:hypothetical protein